MTIRTVFLLGAAVLAGLVLRLHYFTGLIASDDLTHAYSSYWMFTSEADRGFADATAGSVPVRRIGVNIPMWACVELFGVHEWSFSLAPLVFSLFGIVTAWGAARLAAGDAAGLIAAWLWAVLPVDVYHATVWLQDSIFASVLALVLLALIAAERCPRHRVVFGVLAGVVLGYLEYVKETAYLLFLPLLLWTVYRSWRARRIELLLAHVLVGFLLVQAIAGVYFYSESGNALTFWKLTFSRYTEHLTEDRIPRPFPENLVAGFDYLFRQWVYGYGVVVLAIGAVAAVLDKRTPQRLLLGLVLATQLGIIVLALRAGSWTQRYMLQATAPLVILAAVGLDGVSRRLSEAWRGRCVALAGVAVVCATALALRGERQQHGRFRAEDVRRAFAYLEATAGPNDRIYTFGRKVYYEGAGVPYYTLRALTVLAGFEPFKGGFGKLNEAYEADSGWVVLTHLEGRHALLGSPEMFRGIPPNWLEVFRSESAGGRFAQVFRVLARDVPAAPVIVDRPLVPAYRPYLADGEMQPMPFCGAAHTYASRRWHAGLAASQFDHYKGGIRCEFTGDPNVPGSHYGGLQLDVPGMHALSFTLELFDSPNIHSVFVYAYGDGNGVAQWRWTLRHTQRKVGYEGPVHLVPGAASHHFEFDGELDPDQIREVHVFLKVMHGKHAGFAIRNVEIAPAASSPPEADFARFEWRRSSLGEPGRRPRRARSGASKSVRLTRTETGAIKVIATGDPTSDEYQYGGLELPVSTFDALRLRMSLVNPDGLVMFVVDGYSAEDERLCRWVWRIAGQEPLSELPADYLLVTGESTSRFEYQSLADGSSAPEVTRVQFFVRVVPGAEAGFVLHELSEGTQAHRSGSQPTARPGDVDLSARFESARVAAQRSVPS